MAKKQKYYVVWEGAMPGIYTSWEKCQEQTKGFANAKFKSFESRTEAEAALKQNFWQSVQKGAPNAFGSTSSSNTTTKAKYPSLQNCICVDAACSGNPGEMEYRGVNPATKEQVFHVGPLTEGTNNIGEFLAIVHGLAFLQKEGKPNDTIFTDSKTAIAWVRNKKLKTTLEQTPRNKKIFELIDRAVAWLHSNTYKNPITKWETEDWGEIPADFGRK